MKINSKNIQKILNAALCALFFLITSQSSFANLAPAEIDIKKIDPSTLSLEQGIMFLQQGLEPHDLINQMLSSTNKSLTENQKELYSYLLTLNIDLDQIEYTEAIESVRKKKLYPGRNQCFLMKNLSSILNSFFTERNEDFYELRKNIEKNKCMECVGLTTTWLYSKWLQFVHPENIYGYNNKWFKKITYLLANWNNKKKFNENEIYDFSRFGSIVNCLSGHDDKNSSQFEVGKRISLMMLDTYDKTPIRKYSIVSKFDFASLKETIEKMVHDDDLIFISYPKHLTGLFKHKDTYYFYDPNCYGGEYKTNHLEKITEKILNNNYNENIIGIITAGFDDDNGTPPNIPNMLKKFNTNIYQEAARSCARLAKGINCENSYGFFSNSQNFNQ